jgi:2-keto-4-pentenoate hydratase/2-oxohepta-3-ene-1,7-dioic acid hydratase in catechol pathway
LKLARIGPPDQEVPVVLHDGLHFALTSLAPDIDGRFWSRFQPARITDELAAGRLPEVAFDGQRLGAPLARPSAVYCIGMNYAAHAAESGAEPPSVPIVFHKAPNTVVGPNDDVAVPRNSTKTDWEVELGVVIGRRATYLESPEESARHIAGFVVVNDLSEREFQLEISGGQWSKGKSCAGFCPTGPYLVTPEEVNHADLRLTSWVNGEARQDSTTADLIFDVDTIVHHLSQFMVLEPGDLICTGTPEGVALSGRFPYLAVGDVVEVEVQGLGRQRQRLVRS